MGWLWRAVALCALVVLFGSLPTSLIGGETVLLDFETDWCGICKVMDPVVEQLVAEGYNIRKVNGDQERELVTRFRVEGYPTFIAVRDGQEVGRRSGQVSKAELVSMLGKADASKIRGQSPDQRGAHPGDPFRRQGTFPAGKSDNDDWQSAPGGIAARGVRTPSNGASPLVQASVRVRIQEGSGQSTGSGTIIDYRDGEALVLTCGHVFREFKSDAQRISVDLFGPGAPQNVPAKLLSYDLNSDVGLVRMELNQPVAAARVAPPGHKCRVGEKVTSVGCDGGAEATERATQVVSVDRYTHAPNLQVAFPPVQGRSGGGLFNSQGFVVGVCNAADREENQGLFASAAAIHAELDRARLQFVYRGTAPGAAANAMQVADASRGELQPLNPIGNSPAPSAQHASLSADERALLDRLRRNPQQAELFVFMPGGQPGAPAGQLVQMSKFSPEFWRMLAETRRQVPVAELTSLESPGAAGSHVSGVRQTDVAKPMPTKPLMSTADSRSWPKQSTVR